MQCRSVFSPRQWCKAFQCTSRWLQIRLVGLATAATEMPQYKVSYNTGSFKLRVCAGVAMAMGTSAMAIRPQEAPSTPDPAGREAIPPQAATHSRSGAPDVVLASDTGRKTRVPKGASLPYVLSFAGHQSAGLAAFMHAQACPHDQVLMRVQSSCFKVSVPKDLLYSYGGGGGGGGGGYRQASGGSGSYNEPLAQGFEKGLPDGGHGAHDIFAGGQAGEQIFRS